MERNLLNDTLEGMIAGRASGEEVRVLQQKAGHDQVKTISRFERLGGGRFKRSTETWQHLDRHFALNQKIRDGQLPDEFITPGAGKKQEMFLDAVVPRLVYLVWKEQYGFDLLTADMNDPENIRMYEKLISASELKGIQGAPVDPRNCRVYHKP